MTGLQTERKDTQMKITMRGGERERERERGREGGREREGDGGYSDSVPISSTADCRLPRFIYSRLRKQAQKCEMNRETKGSEQEMIGYDAYTVTTTRSASRNAPIN